MIVLVIVGYVSWNLRPGLKVFYTSIEEMRSFLALQVFLEARMNGEDIDDGMMELSHPWDVSKTLVLQWPSKKGGKGREVMRVPLAMAFEERYEREQYDGQDE